MRKKILIVEDEAIVAADLKNILELLGYEVPAITVSGERAVIETARFQPDIVLMDTMLVGGMDGITAAGKIRERFGVPVIFLTAYSDNKTLERAKKTEPSGYIIKPFTRVEIKSAVEIALYKAGMEKKLREEKEYTESIIKTAQAIILILDERGRIRDFNPYMEKISGYGIEEVTGKDWVNTFLPAEDRGKIRKLLKRAMTNVPMKGNVNPIKTRDGNLIYIEWYDKTLKDSTGKVTGLLAIGRDVTDRIKAEARVKLQRKKLRQFSGKMLAVREEEKKKFAAALHDEVGAMAVVIGAQLKAAELKIKAAKNKAAIVDIRNTAKMLKKSIKIFKNMSVNLRPPNLDIIGIEGAIQEYIDKIRRITKLMITFSAGRQEINLKGKKSIVLYRVTQEALTNIQKHSFAKNVKISLKRGKEEVTYKIKDDGKGFSVAKLESEGDTKMGIRGMKERVRSIGGKFSVKSSPGQGTEITVTVPDGKRRKK